MTRPTASDEESSMRRLVTKPRREKGQRTGSGYGRGWEERQEDGWELGRRTFGTVAHARHCLAWDLEEDGHATEHEPESAPEVFYNEVLHHAVVEASP